MNEGYMGGYSVNGYSVNGGYMGAGRAFEGYRRLNRA